jgi:hypothetical protein
MHLVEILLPVVEPGKLGRELETLRQQLTEKFGGLTAFVRSPGEGMWVDEGGTERDDVIVLEVMTDMLDRSWWADLRLSLQDRLNQKEIVIRTHVVDKL